MELNDGVARQPIVVRWLWNDCHLLGGSRAYVVEIPAGRIPGLLGAQPHDKEEAYLEHVAACAARLPGTVTPGHVTCIVSADGRVLDSYVQPMFPYSGMWNGYCPLRRMGIRVTDLADLQRISDEQVQKSLDEGIASTWCVVPRRLGWNGVGERALMSLPIDRRTPGRLSASTLGPRVGAVAAAIPPTSTTASDCQRLSRSGGVSAARG